MEDSASLLEDNASLLEINASLFEDNERVFVGDASLLTDNASFSLGRAAVASFRARFVEVPAALGEVDAAPARVRVTLRRARAASAKRNDVLEYDNGATRSALAAHTSLSAQGAISFDERGRFALLPQWLPPRRIVVVAHPGSACGLPEVPRSILLMSWLLRRRRLPVSARSTTPSRSSPSATPS